MPPSEGNFTALTFSMAEMKHSILILLSFTSFVSDSAGQKGEFTASAGLYTPAFVPGNAELIINDSTSAPFPYWTILISS